MTLIYVKDKTSAVLVASQTFAKRLLAETADIFGRLRGRKVLMTCFFGVIGTVLLSTELQAGVLDEIVIAFRTQIENYGSYARTAGITLAFSLAVIELTWTGGRIGLLNNRGPEVMGLFIIKVFVMLILFSLVQSGVLWMGYLSGGFFTLGEGFTGVGMLQPSGTISTGNLIAVRLLALTGGFTIYSGDLFMSLGLFLGALIVWVALAIVAVTQVVVLIEVWLIRELASLFLAFGLLANTAGIAEGYINYLIKTSLKVMLLFLVVHIGNGFFLTVMLPEINASTIDTIGMFGGLAVIAAIIFAVIATSIPNRWTEIVSNVDWGIKSLLYETRF